MKNTYNSQYFFSVIVILSLLVILPGIPQTFAQQSSNIDPEFRKWSLQIHGNTYMGNTSFDVSPFTGVLGSESRIFNPGFGAALEYALTPSFTVKTEYNFSVIENDSDYPDYKNQYQSINLGLNVYFLELFELYRLSSWFNPNVSLFLGHSHNSLSNMENRDDDSYWFGHYGFGLGTRFKLSETLDWTLGYQYKVFNYDGTIDGGVAASQRELMGSDRLAGFTTGISIKFGNTSRHHATWYSSAHETDHISNQLDQAARERREEFEALQRQLTQHNQKLQELEQQQSALDANMARNEDMTRANDQINQLGKRVSELENRLEEIKKEEEVFVPAPEDGLITGYYVQTFAGRGIENTNNALEITRNGLRNQGVDVDDLQFHIYQLPNGLYTVQIGPYQTVQQAIPTRNEARGVFDDSFIFHSQR